MEKIYKIALIFLFLGVLPVVAEAATLYFSPSSGEYAVGSTFSASVYVSSAEQAMNAASGVISFPKDKLEITSLSKTGSIFSLWVQEPLFSNSAGTIQFEGIVLNPGFSGSAGKIITITFRGKTTGNASLTFSSGSVLANDGKGTNILTNMASGAYTIQSSSVVPAPPSEEETAPKPTSGTPLAPEISSLTHPEPEKWYSNNDPEFSWKLPSDVKGVSLLLTKNPTSNPGPVSDGLMESKKYENLEDGIYYFHIKFRNSYGWGPITHFKVQIDTKPPQPFEITVKEGKETTNPRPILLFETKDDLSGIEYYEVKIGEGDKISQKPPALAHNPFQMPLQNPGKHTVIVKAVDGAENYTLAITEINILAIEAPVITDYPQTLLPGAILSIKGTAASEAKVKVYIQKNERETEAEETKSDKEGKWSYIGTEPLEKGVYKVWAEAIDSLGAKSKPSEKITIQVTPLVFIRIGKLAIDYFTVIITLLVLILVLVLGIIWSWQKNKPSKKKKKKIKRLRKEIIESEKALHYAFKALREGMKEQIEKLDGKPGLNEREKKICEDLKEALKVSEKFISKEIKDIEKEVK